MVLREERKGIDKKFHELCTKVVEDEGLSLYDMDYLPGSNCLRIYINTKDTDTALIEDCARVDKALNPYIEESDWMPEILNLEVSSPGLFRQLTCVEHFKASCEKDINIQLKSALLEYTEEAEKLHKKQKSAKKVIGNLKEVNDEGIVLDIDGITIAFPFTEIKKANLETKF